MVAAGGGGSDAAGMIPADRRRFAFLAVLISGASGPLAFVGCGGSEEAAPAEAEPVAAEPTPPGGWPAGPLFENVTAAVGVDFVRFDGRLPDADGLLPNARRMHEWPGGGVAAFDYDADGRPDLLFTQGRDWPAGPHPPGPDAPPDPAHRDALYRNVGGTRFADVSAAARLPAGGFSHGVSAGDYDGDGFPDLYVCDIAGTRLLRNGGDGTFEDVTAAATIGPGGDRTGGALPAAWAISAAMADLNADGLPDLYDACYVHSADLYTLVCIHDDGLPRECAPRDFDPTPDRLLLNLGDGTFADASAAARLPAGSGKAVPTLGVLVANLDGAPGAEMFVAADMHPNNLFVRRDGDPGEGPDLGVPVPRLVDFGRLSGADLGGPRKSDKQACMGVACGDVNADGRPDLFVTNFRNEANALYRNWSAGNGPLFEDQAAAAGLVPGGYETLGFGAQFLDADRDGDPDLIYTNGHIAQMERAGERFRMKPALYLNDGAGRFFQVPPAVAGPHFDVPGLGRGLARLDWDGDGRDEAAVNTMNSPATVLRNATAGGSGVTLRAIDAGPGRDRDAVGSTVTVTVPTDGYTPGAPSGPRAMFVTAGDGYAASNERALNFGLGAAPDGAALVVSVKWPDGAEEAFSGVTAGGRFLLVRGRGGAVALR